MKALLTESIHSNARTVLSGAGPSNDRADRVRDRRHGCRVPERSLLGAPVGSSFHSRENHLTSTAAALAFRQSGRYLWTATQRCGHISRSGICCRSYLADPVPQAVDGSLHVRGGRTSEFELSDEPLHDTRSSPEYADARFPQVFLERRCGRLKIRQDLRTLEAIRYRRAGRTAIAPVLKTGARKGLQVRILCSPQRTAFPPPIPPTL